MELRFSKEAAKRLQEIPDPRIRRACTWFYEQTYYEEPGPKCDFDLDYFVRLVLRGLSHPSALVDLLEGRIDPEPIEEQPYRFT